MVQKVSNCNTNNEKVLVIGNRLANINTSFKRNENTENLNQSNDALESFLHSNLHHQNSIKKHPQSNNSLHVDSAVSISGVSQQSNPAPLATTPTAPQVLSPPPRDDAQMVDFVSAFLFPIVFIIFNIVYWMVYLNMQVESAN